MRVLNAIDPATAADIRAAISGKPRLREAKPKKTQPIKCYVGQFHRFDPAKNTHTVQLALAFHASAYNTNRTPYWQKQQWVKEARSLVWQTLGAYMSGFDATRVRHIEFVRMAVNKLDDDNLVAAFKAVRDATCSYLVHGRDCWNHVKTIGQADDKLAKAGVTWTYRQQKCESNPRLYGVRIVMHCAPLSTPQPEPSS